MRVDNSAGKGMPGVDKLGSVNDRMNMKQEGVPVPSLFWEQTGLQVTEFVKC
jgi:hypothetical protein